MEIYKPYFLQIVSVIFLVAFFFFDRAKTSRNFSNLILFLLYLLVSSAFIFRDYQGNIDIPRYLRFYEQNVHFLDIFTSSSAWKADYFFFILMPLAHLFGLSGEGYITAQLLLSVGLTFIAINIIFKSSKKWIYLTLFLTINSSSFYLIHGNVIRQGLASSLLLLVIASTVTSRQNLYKVLGFFTHKGVALSFLTRPFKLLDTIRPVVFIVAALVGYFALIIIILNFLILPEFVQKKVEFYTEFKRASSNSILKLLILIIFNFLFFSKLNKSEVFRKTHGLFFIYSVFAVLLFRFDGMFSRLILYTDIFVPILTIGFITSFDKSLNRTLALVGAIICSFLYSIYVFNHKSILFNMGEYFVF
ncbi:EpsG family protein [Croceivirga thetidis]|uniref:EpsG family protein n=1 Tax=Croceivirga thetidis TaxID=2721623 RepID=A0ABX1GMU3_9FLAO|nr:EpsG family protein [Croceivirga thetidis]NKI31194.1 hypothetical protein [Croceivirga thetidis]